MISNTEPLNASARKIQSVSGAAKEAYTKSPPASEMQPHPLISVFTSIPVLVSLLVFTTVLAAGPLHGLDMMLNQPWSKVFFADHRQFIDDVIDSIAGQAVVAPILFTIACWLSWKHKSRRPLLIAIVSEIGVVGLVGSMKVILARPSPVLGDPAFFHGGLFTEGGYGIIFPSGHAAQAVALYGIIVYLLQKYADINQLAYYALCAVVAIIALVTVVTSLYLGWHWATDLMTGLVAGGLVLRCAVWGDRALEKRKEDPWKQPIIRDEYTEVR